MNKQKPPVSIRLNTEENEHLERFKNTDMFLRYFRNVNKLFRTLYRTHIMGEPPERANEQTEGPENDD